VSKTSRRNSRSEQRYEQAVALANLDLAAAGLRHSRAPTHSRLPVGFQLFGTGLPKCAELLILSKVRTRYESEASL
jgi:hypothetical protein